MTQISVRYGFIRARQLEGTYPGDPKLGVWGITSHRVRFGWGMVSEREWPYGKSDGSDFLEPEPPGLDQSAKRDRVHHYERVRSSADVRTILDYNAKIQATGQRKQNGHAGAMPLGVQVAFELTREFIDAPRGQVAMPPADAPVLGTHSVGLTEFSHAQRSFGFVNSWGPHWGDHGKGYMPSEFVDEWMTESWAVDRTPSRFPECGGIQELRWDTPDPLGDRLHGLEIYDGDADERIGWSFVVHRGDHFDIEELYVRPAYRRRGFGSRLVNMVLDLASAQQRPLRAWIPFVDCHDTNRPALARAMRKLGLNVRRSGVRWAAYLALPSKRGTVVFDEVRIPSPPAYSRSEARRPQERDRPPNGAGNPLPEEGEISDEGLTEIAQSLFRALDAEEPGMPIANRGEVWIADLGYVVKTRPCLVLSVPYGDADRAVVTLVAHTTSVRGSDFEVVIGKPFLRAGAFDAQNLLTVQVTKLLKKIGTLSANELRLVERAVKDWLGL